METFNLHVKNVSLECWEEFKNIVKKENEEGGFHRSLGEKLTNLIEEHLEEKTKKLQEERERKNKQMHTHTQTEKPEIQEEKKHKAQRIVDAVQD